jgi:proline iminopeptidase
MPRIAALLLVMAAAACRTAPTPSPPGAASDGEHQLQAGDARLWYRVAGRRSAAPPVVFLHGGPGQGSAHFDALAGPFLERSLRMVYFDQRGSGHSERPASGDYRMQRLVEDVEALRLALGVERVALIGHSFGGTLALEYAAAHPERVSHLVFVAGLWDTPRQCRLRLLHLAERRPEAYARVRGDTLTAEGVRRSDCELELQAFASGREREAYNLEAMFPDPAVSTRIDSVNAAHGIRNTGEMGRALFSSGLLQYRFTGPGRVTMPVLIVGGRQDGAARPEGLRELAGLLPRARFVEFERSGHFVYLDEPERFAREITAFVTR